MARYIKTERLGVIAVDKVVTDDLNWIFREQPIMDMGIDAQIELVDNGLPTGKLIAAQIKTGKSYFIDQGENLIFYGKLVHLEYWLEHSLPVILIGHFPEDNQSYWLHITEEYIERTETAWKAYIPKSNKFDRTSKPGLEKIGDGTEFDQRMRKIILQKPILKKLHEGDRIFLETEEWIIKSLGRGNLKLIHRNKDGMEISVEDSFHYYAGYEFEEILEVRFPWAQFAVDEEYYDMNSDELAEDEIPLSQWRQGNLYPYRIESGEVAQYRIELSLSDKGKHMYDFLCYLETGFYHD